MNAKLLILTLLVTSMSCGKIKVGTGGDIGEIRSFQEGIVADSGDVGKIIQICQALQVKSVALPTMVNTVHTFNTSQTNCQGNPDTSGIVNTVIQKPMTNYIFKRLDNGLDFVFTDVETPTSGTMGEICSKLPALTNPFKTAGGVAVWFTTSTEPTDCSPNSKEVCIKVESGLPDVTTGGTNMKIITKEWIKFKIDPSESKVGFFSDRKRIAQGFCTEGESIQTRATLQ